MNNAYGLVYLHTVPTSLPNDGRILVHSLLYNGQKLSDIGFRFWLAQPDAAHQQPCGCAFAPGIAQHYRRRPPTA